MSVTGTIEVACPACGLPQDVRLVQSINAASQPEDLTALLSGELNTLVCACGRRTQLESTVLFHDPTRDIYVQVVPGGEPAMKVAARVMLGVGATGPKRLVPSLNALVEKVKLAEAELADGPIEVAKLLLLAALDPNELDRPLLFDRIEGEVLHWILYDGARPEPKQSSRAAYDKLATSSAIQPAKDDLRVDRAWAVAAFERLMAAGN
jgi:hypothetical protein